MMTQLACQSCHSARSALAPDRLALPCLHKPLAMILVFSRLQQCTRGSGQAMAQLLQRFKDTHVGPLVGYTVGSIPAGKPLERASGAESARRAFVEWTGGFGLVYRWKLVANGVPQGAEGERAVTAAGKQQSRSQAFREAVTCQKMFRGLDSG